MGGAAVEGAVLGEGFTSCFFRMLAGVCDGCMRQRRDSIPSLFEVLSYTSFLPSRKFGLA